MEKLYEVLISDIALEHLEDIPSKYISKILDTIELLESFPELGFEVQSLNWSGYRQLIIEWYRVVYKVESEKKLIVIHLVKHGRMNFQ